MFDLILLFGLFLFSVEHILGKKIRITERQRAKMAGLKSHPYFSGITGHLGTVYFFVISFQFEKFFFPY